jgi:recombination DNA repair RAD52 pathway protein
MKEHLASRGQAIEHARKEAVTDGLKRTARQYENLTGNCIYNKDCPVRVSNVKGLVDRIDFCEDTLYIKWINKRTRAMIDIEMSTKTKDTIGYTTSDRIEVVRNDTTNIRKILVIFYGPLKVRKSTNELSLLYF